MSRENVELVRHALAGYARRTVDPVRDIVAEDFKFHMRPEFPVQDMLGIDDMLRFWTDLDESFAEYGLTPTDFTEIDDYVVVALLASFRINGSEDLIREPIHQVWHVSEGKIREAWAFRTRQEALAALGLSE